MEWVTPWAVGQADSFGKKKDAGPRTLAASNKSHVEVT
jgi:hypothetical protein